MRRGVVLDRTVYKCYNRSIQVGEVSLWQGRCHWEGKVSGLPFISLLTRIPRHCHDTLKAAHNNFIFTRHGSFSYWTLPLLCLCTTQSSTIFTSRSGPYM